MEDMARIPYLIADDKGRKLRRNVPKDIQQVIGKTAWVERLGSMPADEIKRRAYAFGVFTSEEIAACRNRSKAMLVVGEQGQSNADKSISLELTAEQAEEIARTYFANVEYQRLMDRTYARSNIPFDEDPLAVASLDLAEACDAAAGLQSYVPNDQGNATPLQAWRLLYEAGRLPSIGNGRNRLPSWLIGAPNFQYLCRLLERADVQLAQRKLQSVQNGRFPSDDIVSVRQSARSDTSIAPTQANQRTLSELIAEFERRKQREVGASRLSQFKLATRALLEEVGGTKVLREIGRQDCQSVVDLLARTPAYVSQHYSRMTVRAAADAYVQKHGHPAEREAEAQRPFAVIKAVFALAVQLDWVTTDPSAKIELRKPHVSRKRHASTSGYQPFEISELNRIFLAPLYVGCLDDETGFSRPGANLPMRSRYWVPLVSLWSGLRMTEALQLERSDIRLVNGVYAISVNDTVDSQGDCSAYDKRLKNANAARDVPIHRILHDLGFVDWALSRNPGPMFPEAFAGGFEMSSNQFSKRFASFLKSIDLWQPRKKVFHSLRNNFNDALRAGQVAVEYRDALCGWSSHRSMDQNYGRGYKINLLKEQIDKAVFDGLSLDHLRPFKPKKVGRQLTG